jgi:mono/diheme cytochrome c family protein
MLTRSNSRHRKKQQIATIGVVAMSCLFIFLQKAGAQNQIDQANSKSAFLLYCASCHGRTGEGNGPMAAFLTTAPANLTLLAKRNHGSFPYASLEEVIDGRKTIASHGIREMPIWGTRFRREADNSQSPLPHEIQVNKRIKGLIDYIESIQSE